MTNLAFTCRNSDLNGYVENLTVTLAAVEQPGINVAPSACWFQVANVTGCAAGDATAEVIRNPKFHDIAYVWDFGDTANATPSTAADLNMPATWKNINRAYGMRAAHVFNDPGTYTVTVWAYEPATRRKGRAQVSVTVGNPVTVFPTTRTIIYNPNSIDVSGYGYSGYQNITTNWAAVLTARNAIGSGTTAQILIAPGVTITNTQLANSPNWANIRIGGLDPDVKPVIGPFLTENSNPIVVLNSTTISDRIIFGLAFEGDWDSTTETGVGVKPFNMNNLPTGSTCIALTHRCSFDGYNQVDGFTQSEEQQDDIVAFYLMHSELTVTNWKDYGLHGMFRYGSQQIHTAVVGCSVAQHEDALSGGDKDFFLYNRHGPFRSFGDTSVFMSVNYLFSRNGWSTAGNDAAGYATPADQACIRLNTDANAGTSGVVDRCAMEGSIWLEPENDQRSRIPGNYVFDKVLQVLPARTLQQGIEVRYGGATFRNMLGFKADVPAAQNNHNLQMFYLANDGVPNDAAGTAAKVLNNASSIDIYDCTYVDLRDNTNAEGSTIAFRANDTGTSPAYLSTTNTFATQTVENNIFEQPNRSPAVEPDAPLDMATDTGFVTRHKGPRFNFLDEQGTLSGAVVDDAYFTLSYANVKTTRYNTSGVDDGSATDQAYWLANGGTRHHLRMGGASRHSHLADNIEVTFEASEIRIYNRTGATWTAGTAWGLLLQRTAALPAWDATLDSSGMLVPLARPTTGSAAINDGDTGKKAYDDFMGTVRPVTGNERGALLTA